MEIFALNCLWKKRLDENKQILCNDILYTVTWNTKSIEMSLMFSPHKLLQII